MSNGETICGVVDWGEIPYLQACRWQEELVDLRKQGEIPDLLILCEHPPVITLGRNADLGNILAPDSFLVQRGVDLHSSNRGGDVTFHGPGQLVGYPILDLHNWKKDVVSYVHTLEEALIQALSRFGVTGRRLEDPEPEAEPGGQKKRRKFHTGVWVDDPQGRPEKIAAIGVHLSRWVTSHGFAWNISTDLSYFGLIVPCGIGDKGVTALERLVPESTPRTDLMAAARSAVIECFGAAFGRRMQTLEPDQWEAWLGAHQATAP